MQTIKKNEMINKSEKINPTDLHVVSNLLFVWVSRWQVHRQSLDIDILFPLFFTHRLG